MTLSLNGIPNLPVLAWFPCDLEFSLIRPDHPLYGLFKLTCKEKIVRDFVTLGYPQAAS
jgi:hypothetical protein